MNKDHTTIKIMTAFKRQRNCCVSLRRKNIKSFPQQHYKNGHYYKKKLLNFQQAIPYKKDF